MAFHGRTIAAYLVHECAHSSVFYEPAWNTRLGVFALWVCGCPYVDFQHIKALHLAHHRDRADTTSFDYQAELEALPRLIPIVLALEYCFVPAVETLIHLRIALYPPQKRCSMTAACGSAVLVALWAFIWRKGGWPALGRHCLAAALLIHFLSIHDAFQHTFDVITPDDVNYVPGPGARTAEYEDKNTYSNLVSARYPAINLLSLNFGFHNAHHKKPMAPWYDLPEIHAKYYGVDTPQVLPFADIVHTWIHNRVRRVLEPDYGVVGTLGTPGRADAFVGALGVSFLTA
ncbi:hypothetical protein CTAYLR_002686 [Chrysophaeum taylorii]|uniref:Fatty acid desaturase domain-containing protein n=1 Tax=Chrysophaeum taylorii TaxID=2483200 RepID=A0AAD7UBR8_9STRA|nr:hypothetical protein CTAYLR_002686 [Chrysophaeum taylorii]